MSTLSWTDELQLGLQEMDRTHEEFIDLLARVEAAGDGALVDAWQALVAHTEAHFGQEDRWMAEAGLPAANCHSMQHLAVLRVMRDALVQGRAGDLQILRLLARELAVWFPQHALAADAALARHVLDRQAQAA